MNTNKHTPGPWLYLALPPCSVISVPGDGKHICQMEGIDLEIEEANARLIAAAPELFDALATVFMSGVMLTDEITDQITKALRKATGEGA